MRRISLKTWALTLAAATLAVAVTATRTVATAEPQAPAAQALQSIGPLAFAPDGVLFAADRQAATIYAIDLGAKATGGAPGAKDVTGIDAQIASMLGTDPKEVQITDLAVHPKTRNAFISVMRGTGADAKPALLRVDGAGKIEVVALDGLKMTKATLPNAPAAAAAGQRNPRMESITDMAFVDGKLVVAGLSNEEFSSKLRTVPYPFAAVDAGTSVEIYHGNHGQFETRSPVISFVPVQARQHAEPDRRLHLHAAREVPGREPHAGREGHGHDDRRARQPQSADRHDRLQEGRQGLSADRQHQPRRDEGPDRRVCDCARHHGEGQRPKPAALASSRSRR